MAPASPRRSRVGLLVATTVAAVAALRLVGDLLGAPPYGSEALFVKEVSKTMDSELSIGERAKTVATKWKALGAKEKNKIQDQVATVKKASEDSLPNKKEIAKKADDAQKVYEKSKAEYSKKNGEFLKRVTRAKKSLVG
mmetsp:Transcript_173152/g.555295  ORF Transcript_173152/g.555295 Transcript_173152/m.555295 type:complete len:139 (-) Transcript_173152:79-495(-)